MARIRSTSRAALAAVAVLGWVVAAAATSAQARSRQIETEAVFVAYDAASETISVKVIKAGARPSDRGLALRKGREESFSVVPTGSVLVRTIVKNQDGTAGSFDDLEAGRRVRVFWLAEDGQRKARSVSVFVPAEEVGEDAE
jgi:hypothetical protein